MKVKLIISTIVIFVVMIFSCKKTPELPTGSNKIEMGETIEDTTMYQYSIVTSSVSAIAGNTITQHGHCWSINNKPTIQGSHTSLGVLNSPKSFTSELDSLESNTKYYVRLYLAHANGVIYGEEISITTLKTGIPTVNTSEVTNITLSTAQCGGNAVADSGLIVIEKGVCWNTDTIVNIENNIGITTDGDSLGTFTSLITELQEGINYYVKAYSTNEKGTSYGETKQFSTVAITLPEVITATPTNILASTATSGGVVISNGNGTVTARGVCWNTNGNPTLENSLGNTNNGDGLGEFTSNVYGLTDNTTYYISAYATNEKGTFYGEIMEITTLEIVLPEVTTSNIINLTMYSAQSGGNVTSAGNGIVSARGICWSTTTNPTITDNHSADGTGTGGFESTITGLSPTTQYFARAYAVNSTGTAYGNEISFTTLSNAILPSVTTNEAINITQTTANSGGNVTLDGGADVTARGVCWSSTNIYPDLDDSHTTDGTGSGVFTSLLTGLTPNTFYYVRAYATNSVGTTYGNTQNLMTLDTPTIPTVTTAEAINITQTEVTTGGTVHANGGATVTARGVCYSTTTNPTLSNSHTTNGNGLGTFVSILTSLIPNTQYYVRSYATNSEGTAYGNEITFITLSDVTLPTVMTDEASNITQTTTTSGGNITDDGGADVTARGVCWSISNNPTLSDNYTTDGSGTGTFVSELTGLTANTLYYVRAYATNSEGTAYGNEINFTTLPPQWQCGDILSYEGQDYTTVLIGTQCWMAENLNVGLRINGAQEQTDNSQIEKYCYDNDENNCDTYGGLYQWDEMMEYTTTQGTQGICPANWHLPTDDEWKILEGNADTQYGVGNPEWDGENWRGYDAGQRLKTTTGWNTNTGTDAVGFSALPSGIRGIDGNFNNIGSYGYWWQSSESGTKAWYRALTYNSDEIARYDAGKINGQSVRCLKD